MGKYTVHINTLADCRIALQLQFGRPEFCLSYQYDSHRAHGIKTIVQKKSKFFQCFFFQQMCFIKNTDDFFVLHSTDDFNLLLQLAFGIPPIEAGFQAQLIQKSFIELIIPRLRPTLVAVQPTLAVL